MASARRGAMVRVVTFSPLAIGVLFVQISSSIGDSWRRLRASSLRTAWETPALTDLAPRSIRSRAAAARVPAVSVMSSISTTLLSLTLPMMLWASTSVALRRSLATMAMSTFKALA